MIDENERELRKKAIFDGMAKRGQERILRIGYDTWDPFQEPKDPRERIFGVETQKASALVAEFYETQSGHEESVSLHKELFDLGRGYLLGENRCRIIIDFCAWFKNRVPK